MGHLTFTQIQITYLTHADLRMEYNQRMIVQTKLKELNWLPKLQEQGLVPRVHEGI